MISASSLPDAFWRKSSHSGNNGGDCLEVVDGLPNAIPVRDSKNPTGPALIVTPAAWSSFVSAIQRGELRD